MRRAEPRGYTSYGTHNQALVANLSRSAAGRSLLAVRSAWPSFSIGGKGETRANVIER